MNIFILDKSLVHDYETKIKNQIDKEDSGLDVICKETISIDPHTQGKIKFGIACQPKSKNGFWLLPRSSIYKTPLRMANSIGLIDYGYRGEIMAVVDNISNETFNINKGDVYFQLCLPSLECFETSIVDYITDTKRGTGGFGSTGLRV